jgi:ELWxxDGT repeat protein
MKKTTALLLFGLLLATHGASASAQAPAELVRDISTQVEPFDRNPGWIGAVGDGVFFAADHPTLGRELWWSDGTSEGTVLVKDINPGIGRSDVRGITNFDGTLFFSADDGTRGRELWRSDGTEAGTVLVKDINPGERFERSSSPEGFTPANVSGVRPVPRGSRTSTAPCSSRPTTGTTVASCGGATARRRGRCCSRTSTPASVRPPPRGSPT